MKKIMQLNNLCGIDVGCTNIKMVALVNNRIIKKTVSSGDSCTKSNLIDYISDFYLSCNHKFDGLGIAFSGYTFDGKSVSKGSLQCLDELKTSDFSHLSCPKIELINDSNATCLAGVLEYPDSKVLLAITNGTAIGMGIAINGKLFTGAFGIAGEIYGNPVFSPDSHIMKVGKLCSGSKILKANASKKVISQASQYLGMTIVSMIHTFNPDIIYLSGGGFNYENFIPEIREFIYSYTYPDFLTNLKVVESSFSSYSGCYGAMKKLLD